MRIGIDLDDVLIDLNLPLATYHNATYGTNYHPSEIRSFRFEEVWKCTTEEVYQRLNLFHETYLPHQIPPMDGAVDTLQRLKGTHEFFIVTGRSPTIQRRTEEIINYYFPSLINEIHFTGKPGYHVHSKTKAEVCKSLSIEMFIEDNHTWAHEIAGNEIPVFLFNRPWNQEPVTHSNITRVETWNQIETHIQTMEKKQQAGN